LPPFRSDYAAAATIICQRYAASYAMLQIRHDITLFDDAYYVSMPLPDIDAAFRYAICTAASYANI